MSAKTFDFGSRIDEILRVGEDLGLSSSEVHRVFTAVLAEEGKEGELQLCQVPVCEKEAESRKVRFVVKISSALKNIMKVLTYVVIVGIVSCSVISLHNPTKKFVTRNIQDLIYPVMTALRQVTLPVLNKYPHLSQWYSEECLVPNILFNHGNIDCSTCAENDKFIEISSLQNFTSSYYNTGKYLVVTDAVHKIVSRTVFLKNVDIHQEIEIGAWKQVSKYSALSNTLEEYISKQLTVDIHVEWKINQLETLHLIRQVFPRPYFIPQDTEVALHRFVFIDGPDSESYPLPLPEFANIVIMQGEGESVFSMLPSGQCKGDCSPTSITLKATQVLFYNWMYWRPERLKSGYSSTFAMSSFY